MTDEEYLPYRSLAVVMLAQAEADAFGVSFDEAQRSAVAAFDRLVPNNLLSESEQRLFVVERESTKVGVLWYELRNGGGTAYIYDVFIWPEFRRRGYATQALRLLEKTLRQNGVQRMALNVFHHNLAARRLYDRLGYATVSSLMAHRLD